MSFKQFKGINKKISNLKELEGLSRNFKEAYSKEFEGI
jgi:hypothetical protein